MRTTGLHVSHTCVAHVPLACIPIIACYVPVICTCANHMCALYKQIAYVRVAMVPHVRYLNVCRLCTFSMHVRHFICALYMHALRVHAAKMQLACMQVLVCCSLILHTLLVMCSVSTNGERGSLANLKLTIGSLLECS